MNIKENAKALECCARWDCKNCPREKTLCNDRWHCRFLMMEEIAPQVKRAVEKVGDFYG